MTDSPTSGRNRREARRGVIGPPAGTPPPVTTAGPSAPRPVTTTSNAWVNGNWVEDFGRN